MVRGFWFLLLNGFCTGHAEMLFRLVKIRAIQMFGVC